MWGDSMLKPKIRLKLAELEKKHKDIYSDLKVSPQIFSNWVNGESYPRLPMAFKLARKLNCLVDDLWEYVDEEENAEE
jgi:DNA-binding XRE family transcriptional regulator